MDTRFQVIISKEGFQLVERPRKEAEEGAAATLEKIRRVLREKLPYIGSSSFDPFAALHDNQRRIRLGKVAHLIEEAYLEKANRAPYLTEHEQLSCEYITALCKEIDRRIDEAKKETLQSAKRSGCGDSGLTVATAYQYIKKIADFSSMPYEIWVKILSYCTAKELCISGRVSRQWRILARDNALWQRFYLDRFTLDKGEASGEKPSGYWKTRLKNFFENIRDGIYTEKTVIPLPKGVSATMEVVFRGNFLFIQNPTNKRVIELWEKGDNHSYNFKKKLNVLDGRFVLSKFFCISSSKADGYVQLEEVPSSNAEIAIWQLPDSIAVISVGEERAFALTDSGDLYELGRKDEAGQFRDPLLIPFPEARYCAYSRGFLVAIIGNKMVVLERDAEDNYRQRQILEDYNGLRAIFKLFATEEGVLILVKDTEGSVTVWEMNPSSKEWTKEFSQTQVKHFSIKKNFFVFGEYPSRCIGQNSSGAYEFVRTMTTWHRSENGYRMGNTLPDAIKIEIGSSDPPGEKEWYNSYSVAAWEGFVCMAKKNGDQFIFDALGKTAHKIVIPQEQACHIEAISQNAKVAPHCSSVAFAPDGTLVTKEDRGIVTRRFDVSRKEVLYQIAQGFLDCPSLTTFNSGEEIVNLVRLYHRFYRFDDKTKAKIYANLARIILSTFSIHSLRFLQTNIEDNLTRAEVAFFNGGYYGNNFKYKGYNYSATKEQIAQSILEYVKTSG